MRRGKRNIVAAVMVTGAVLAITGPAFAGSFTSYLSNVQVGFNSRTWQHGTGDNSSTAITLTQCGVGWQDSGGGATVQLTEEQPFPFPDINRGQKGYTCNAGGTQYYGSQPAANYHFSIVSISGGSEFSADYNKVSW